MGGRSSRDKGNRWERKLVHLLQEIGLSARRIPLSGSAGGEFAGDLRVTLPLKWPIDITAEVKARGDGAGFKSIIKWLGDHEALFLCRDRAEPLVVLSWDTFSWIADVLAHNTVRQPKARRRRDEEE